MLPNLLFLLSLVFPFCQSSGYIQLQLKSAIDLPNATFNIDYDWSFGKNKTMTEVYDISLIANKTRVVTGIPVNFTLFPHMFINTGLVNKYGFYRREIYVTGLSYMKRITTENVDLPFTGLRFERVCDRNWHGYNCKYFCNNDYASIVGRQCTQDGKVGCPLGFHGSNCDQPIDQKTPDCQCKNEGICVSWFVSPLSLKDNLLCECPIGWDGEKCEHEEYGLLTSYTFDKTDSLMFRHDYENTSVDNEFYER